MDEATIRGIVRELLERPQAAPMQPVPLEVSARHVHLTQAAVEALFGPGATLTPKRALSQPGEFLSEQRVKLIGPKGVIENTAVLGPARNAIQVELSLTDCRQLGVKAPVNLSGDLTGAGSVMLAGDAGCINAPGSVIAARAHIHMTPADAARFGVQDGQRVGLRIQGCRPVTMEDVPVRVRDNFALAAHIDFDEANAACAACGAEAYVVNPGCRATAAAPAAQPAQKAQAPAVLADKLISEAAARGYAREGGTLHLRKGCIVTPAAKDVLSAAHMKLEYHQEG